jgi:hypothetical protein
MGVQMEVMYEPEAAHDDDEGEWPAEYKERFFEAIEKHGDSWQDVAAEMGDRNIHQVLALAHELQGFMGTRRPMPDDVTVINADSWHV